MSPAKIALKALHRHFTVFHRYYRTACDKGTVRSIHQLRTNARRFRNALKTYSLLFDKAAVKRFNRLLQMTAREASQLRDLDVYLFFCRITSPNCAATSSVRASAISLPICVGNGCVAAGGFQGSQEVCGSAERRQGRRCAGA